MLKHETKTCPRCNTAFECKVGDITNCQCNIEISNNTKEFLAKTNYDCLCVNCLQHLNHLVNVSTKYNFPTQKEFLIEGLHYYKEDSNWVFTELYHLLRGYCCKSGCRHCVYGYKNQA
ncbi:MAG: hypothetical protein EAZ07_06965 [Cytophagales bacterium]|nr:MAG: hypothetical protein EAZ07_06965 [Cytophagales bacterium]